MISRYYTINIEENCCKKACKKEEREIIIRIVDPGNKVRLRDSPLTEYSYQYLLKGYKLRLRKTRKKNPIKKQQIQGYAIT